MTEKDIKLLREDILSLEFGGEGWVLTGETLEISGAEAGIMTSRWNELKASEVQTLLVAYWRLGRDTSPPPYRSLCQLGHWTYEEAALLSLGINPDKVLTRRRLIERNTTPKDGASGITPAQLLKLPIPIPCSLRSAIEASHRLNRQLDPRRINKTKIMFRLLLQKAGLNAQSKRNTLATELSTIAETKEIKIHPNTIRNIVDDMLKDD